MELIGAPGSGATELADPPSMNMLGSYTILCVRSHPSPPRSGASRPVWCICRLCSELNDDQGRRERDGGRGEQAKAQLLGGDEPRLVEGLPASVVQLQLAVHGDNASADEADAVREGTLREREEHGERGRNQRLRRSGCRRRPHSHRSPGIHPRRARTTGPSETVRLPARGCRRRPGRGRPEPTARARGGR